MDRRTPQVSLRLLRRTRKGKPEERRNADPQRRRNELDGKGGKPSARRNARRRGGSQIPPDPRLTLRSPLGISKVSQCMEEKEID